MIQVGSRMMHPGKQNTNKYTHCHCRIPSRRCGGPAALYPVFRADAPLWNVSSCDAHGTDVTRSGSRDNWTIAGVVDPGEHRA